MSENPRSPDVGTDLGADTKTNVDTHVDTGQSPQPAQTFKADEADQADEPHSSTVGAVATAATTTTTAADAAADAAAPLRKRRRSIQRLEILCLMLLLLLLVLGVFVPMAMYAYRHVFVEEPRPRASVVQNAGRVVSVSQSGGFIVRALVETDLGYYALMDGVSLNKNEALTLETRADRLPFLCDSQHRCVHLVADGQAQ